MTAYEQYQNTLSKITDVARATGLLHWDLEVYMPKGGIQARARQIGTLSGIAHEMATSPDFGDLLKSLDQESLDTRQRRNVELAKKDYDQEVKLDKAFVEELATAQSMANRAWAEARSKDDFSIFEPSLTTLVELKRKEAAIRGFESEPYDALLDLYEPGLKAKELDRVFGDLKTRLIPLILSINAKPQPGSAFLEKRYPKDDQWAFGIEILKRMGYDMHHGRQDISTHPFTISFAPSDVRVTTRVDENDLMNMTWSCIHEGGHALYEQGLPESQYGLPLGSACSLAIHESQSRLWENHVGRSTPFWTFWYPKLKARFPENLSDVSLEEFYRAINRIEPNLIRTEADELHYHLHVLIRYEVERALINGQIEVADLPAVWDSKYKEYIGIDVPDRASGVLQDVHWSHGSFGYFPTYTLGSLYAAQFYDAACKALPDLESDFVSGNYERLLGWLREHIHQYGRQYDPAELCRRVTDEELNADYFVDYASEKFGAVYT